MINPLSSQSNRITLAMTGASGACYWLKLLEWLIRANFEIHLVCSSAGQIVLTSELTEKIPLTPKKMQQFLTEKFEARSDQIQVYGKDEWSAPIASGGSAPTTMVVCPCTTGCVSAIAHGASDNLIERAADVVIKERGQLILVIREMPFSTIHLTNMLALAKLGVCIMPASPGFYFHPTQLSELVDFVVGKILDQLKVAHQLTPKWSKEYL